MIHRSLALLAPVLVSLTIGSLVAPSARAAVPSLDLSTASVNSAYARVIISPAAGTQPSATGLVTITLLDASGQPVANYPRQDVWAQPTSGEVLLACDGSPGFMPATDSDANGQMNLNVRLSGTGFVRNGLQVYVGGAPLAQAPLPIPVTSVDIDGDFDVDLTDVGIFASVFAAGPSGFDPRADFEPDGTINTPDLGELAVHYGEKCP